MLLIYSALQSHCATTRQMIIERKLVELDHKPLNVQVILQDKDQSVHKIFLVDDNVVICQFTHTIST